MHTRRVYNIVDVITDFGGLLGGILVLVKALIFPVSFLNFYLNAASKLFIAKTYDGNVFKNIPPIQKETNESS